MLLMNPEGNKVLVQSRGNINLFIEPEPARRWTWARVKPTLPVLGAAVVVSCVVSSLCAVVVTIRVRDAMEERLTDRIEQLSGHVDAALAAVGDNVASQSDRVSAEVVRVGEQVDRIPAKLDEAAHGTTNAVIAWLSSLRKTEQPVPLLVRTSAVKRK